MKRRLFIQARRFSCIWLAAVVGILASPIVAAQSACPFAVSGASSATFAVDGALLLRYAGGLRNQQLTASLVSSPPLAHTAVTQAIEPHRSTRLDLDGDGFFTTVDAMVAARHIAGFAPTLLDVGLNIPVNATRRTGTAIADFIQRGCPDPTVAPPRVMAVLPRGDKVSVNAPIVVFFSKAMNKASAQSAITTSPPVSCTWTWNDAVHAATCQPTSNLPSNTPVSITVATSARDSGGVSLASAGTGSFRTFNGNEVTAQTFRYPLDASPTTPAGGDFRIQCFFSHASPNDPLVALGINAGSHLHTFFGNVEVDAYTTPDLVRTMGGSTCHGGTLNRSGYWIPAILDAAGNFVRPANRSFNVYYKRDGLRPSATMQPMPRGLRMISGSAAGTPANPVVWRGGGGGLSCIDPQTESNVPPLGPPLPPEEVGRAMPHCPPGSRLHFAISFPRCWDGVNLDSTDHRSHVSGAVYDPTRADPNFAPYENLTCPDSHPVALAALSVGIDFPVPSGGTVGWRMASDAYNLSNARGGYSIHADFYNGWNEEVKAVWTTKCLNERRHCADGELGDNRALISPARGAETVTLAAAHGEAWIDQLIAASMCGSAKTQMAAAPEKPKREPQPNREPIPALSRTPIAVADSKRILGLSAERSHTLPLNLTKVANRRLRYSEDFRGASASG